MPDMLLGSNVHLINTSPFQCMCTMGTNKYRANNKHPSQIRIFNMVDILIFKE